MAIFHIYKNLAPTLVTKARFKGETNFFSIRYNGIIKDVVPELIAFDCDFHVNENGRLRVVEKRRKNVHSWVKAKKYKLAKDTNVSGMEKLYYDPYFTQAYYSEASGEIVTHAAVVVCKDGCCYAGGINGVLS